MKNFLLLTVLLSTLGSTSATTFCTMEYLPICGKNADGIYQTYGNQCVMDSDNGKKLFDGECSYTIGNTKFTTITNIITEKYLPLVNKQHDKKLFLESTSIILKKFLTQYQNNPDVFKSIHTFLEMVETIKML